jgi:hypothetical protein
LIDFMRKKKTPLGSRLLLNSGIYQMLLPDFWEPRAPVFVEDILYNKQVLLLEAKSFFRLVELGIHLPIERCQA